MGMDPFTTSMHSGEPMSHAAPGLRLTDVSQTLSGHAVFSKLSLRLKGQSWHCILGRSGVGKTTLLRLIAGLDAPQGGRITDDCERPLSAQVSYMSQDDGLLPWLSVVENVQLGPRLRRESTPTTHARAIDLLSQVDLLPWADATTDQLSGGMRQRVALARTLLEDRPIVLMDEPFSRLDAITRDELQVLSTRLLQGRTVVLVTHDPHEALRLGHTIHVLQRSVGGTPGNVGRTDIVELGTTLRSQDAGTPASVVIEPATLSATPDLYTPATNSAATRALSDLWTLLRASGPGDS